MFFIDLNNFKSTTNVCNTKISRQHERLKAVWKIAYGQKIFRPSKK